MKVNGAHFMFGRSPKKEELYVKMRIRKMKRVKLVVAYDGTNYHGWQIQPNEISVEEILNEKLSQLTGEEIKVIGASRTDAGVHAMGNVAVFDTESRIPGEKFSYALNQRLPEDIRIQSSEEVAAEFHPRHCDCRKTYRYQILNSEFPIPTERLYAHFIYYDLNLKAMRQAAQYLIGEHDFKSFCSTKTSVTDTVRTIYDVKVVKEDHMISIFVQGNGFLYNMVRIIAGTLIEVGLGRKQPGEIKEMLEQKDRQIAGPTAPAKGLALMKIEYL